MKQALNLTFWLLVLCALAIVGGSAEAQTTANGPYYATPSWDQKLQCDTLATCPRFIVLLNWNSDAVLDRETGLVWEKSPDTTTGSWDQAHVHCRFLTVGSRKGWRLPTAQELLTLIDMSVLGLPLGHPFINAPVSAWTATSTLNPVGIAAFQVILSGVNAGITDPLLKSLTTIRSWCVRGGSGLDAQ